jgi:predicted ATP-grasp superfamily ATP-dependent carboligase
MKKPEVLNLIDNLEGFLENITAINKHPYSTGVDVEKLIKDLQDYMKDMRAVVEQIEELVPDTAEPEEEKGE